MKILGMVVLCSLSLLIPTGVFSQAKVQSEKSKPTQGKKKTPKKELSKTLILGWRAHLESVDAKGVVRELTLLLRNPKGYEEMKSKDSKTVFGSRITVLLDIMREDRWRFEARIPSKEDVDSGSFEAKLSWIRLDPEDPLDISVSYKEPPEKDSSGETGGEVDSTTITLTYQDFASTCPLDEMPQCASNLLSQIPKTFLDNLFTTCVAISNGLSEGGKSGAGKGLKEMFKQLFDYSPDPSSPALKATWKPVPPNCDFDEEFGFPCDPWERPSEAFGGYPTWVLPAQPPPLPPKEGASQSPISQEDQSSMPQPKEPKAPESQPQKPPSPKPQAPKTEVQTHQDQTHQAQIPQ